MLSLKNYLLICTISLVLLGCSKNQNLNIDNQCVKNSDSFCETPLHDAIRAKNFDEIKYLINKTNINSKNKQGYTPLHLAVRLNELEVAKLLIKNNANVNTKDIYQDSALIDSARNRNNEMTKLLICNNAKLDVQDMHKMTPLDYTLKGSLIYDALKSKNISVLCQEKNKKVIVTLLEHHKKINSVVVSNKSGKIILNNPYESTSFNTNKKETLNIINTNKEELENKYPDLFIKKLRKRVKVTLLEHYKDKSSILISNDKGELLLNKAYESADIISKNLAPQKSKLASKKDIFDNYGSLIKEKMNLNFKYNSTEITEQTNRNLDEIIDYINNCEKCKVTIKGHTDTVGEDSFNLELSKKRAFKIKEILEKKGVDSNQIITKFYGEKRPFIKTADEVEQPLNRRVSITVQKGNIQ